MGDYLAQAKLDKLDPAHAAFRRTQAEVSEPRGHAGGRGAGRASMPSTRAGPADVDQCGMSRQRGGVAAGTNRICALREEFWRDATSAHG